MIRQEELVVTSEFDNFLISCPAGKSSEVLTIGEARQSEKFGEFVVGAIRRTEKFLARANGEEEIKEAIEDGFAGALLKDDKGEFHAVQEGEDAASYMERLKQAEKSELPDLKKNNPGS